MAIEFNTRRRAKSVLRHLILLTASVIFVSPFIWMVKSSLTTETLMMAKAGEPPHWLPVEEQLDEQGRRMVSYEGRTGSLLGEPLETGEHRLLVDGQEVITFPENYEVLSQVGFHWENYTEAFRMIDFWLHLRNTLFVCISVVIATVISCSLIAYGFARIEWPGRDILFILVLATMMLPVQVTLIPLFMIYKELGWTGSFKPLIVPYLFGTPFYIFLLRQFFKAIPQDLSQAARIDGCTEFGIFWRIILPLSVPALATTALFMFLYQWADFLSPLIYLQDDRQFTLAVALQQYQNQHEQRWGPLMAMSTVITAPVILLFFLTQRTFIQGITMTGLKG